MRYGIPYDVFWKINPKVMKIYQTEYNRAVKEKSDVIDYSSWLTGRYIINAVQTALDPKKAKYPEQPFGMVDNEEEGESSESSEISAIKFSEYIDAFNKQFKSK